MLYSATIPEAHIQGITCHLYDIVYTISFQYPVENKKSPIIRGSFEAGSLNVYPHKPGGGLVITDNPQVTLPCMLYSATIPEAHIQGITC